MPVKGESTRPINKKKSTLKGQKSLKAILTKNRRKLLKFYTFLSLNGYLILNASWFLEVHFLNNMHNLFNCKINILFYYIPKVAKSGFNPLLPVINM